jgi:pimeloyl-ACP methyl ester carboxylesterase
VLAFIDRVVGGERFVLAGTSLGSYLARGVALRHRARVAGLLLRLPAVIADTAQRTLPTFDPVVRDDALIAAVPDEERAALGNVLVQTPDYLGAARHKSRSLYQPAIAATAPIANEIRADPRRYGFSFDLAAEERGFAAPTLVIAGRQDTTVGYRDAWAILESYPRATFAVLDCADHSWPVETPSLLAPLVDDWLRRIALAEGQ